MAEIFAQTPTCPPRLLGFLVGSLVKQKIAMSTAKVKKKKMLASEVCIYTRWRKRLGQIDGEESEITG